MMTRIEQPTATVARAAAAAGQTPIAVAEEGVGAPGRDRGLAEDLAQVAVAVPGAHTALLLPDRPLRGPAGAAVYGRGTCRL